MHMYNCRTTIQSTTVPYHICLNHFKFRLLGRRGGHINISTSTTSYLGVTSYTQSNYMTYKQITNFNKHTNYITSTDIQYHD